jgi:hypothetical protein
MVFCVFWASVFVENFQNFVEKRAQETTDSVGKGLPQRRS